MACVESMERLNSIEKTMTSTHIIIVNYNAGDWLLRSLASALDFSDGKITVVDNASTDDSISMAKKKFEHQKKICWIINSDNRGFAAANNQVLKNIDEDFAVLMNPDCELNSGTLPLIINAFNEDDQIGLASCKILNLDGTMQSTSRRYFPTPWTALVRMLKLDKTFPNNPKFKNFDYGADQFNADPIQFIEAISGAFMVVRKSALEEVGLLDEEYFMHCEDLDWCKRFSQTKWKVAFINNASVIHAKGISSASRPIGVLWTLHKGMNRFFDKFYQNEYSIWLRLLVKKGIWLSFIVRSLKAIFFKYFISKPTK